MSYDEWIEANYPGQTGYGKCRVACEQMCKVFPELTTVPGHVHCAWGKRGHFWLTAPDGSIVDPTRGQFPGPVDYEPWEPGTEVHCGRCMECGDDIWLRAEKLDAPPHNPHAPFCSRSCAISCEKAMEAGAW